MHILTIWKQHLAEEVAGPNGVRRAAGHSWENEGRRTRPTLDPPKQSFPKYVPKPELGNEEDDN